MERFWKKVYKTKHCWIWKGAIRGKSGYGAVKYNNKTYSAHRFVWLLTYKKWPTGIILHKCDTRLCVRPDHLVDGTYRDNALDAVRKGRMYLDGLKEVNATQLARTHCKNGHEYTPENTLVEKKRNTTARRCRICHRRHTENWRRKKNFVLTPGPMFMTH